MYRRAAWLLGLTLLVALLPLAGTPPARAISPDVVISQVYGGGGNSGATLTNDFIELYNRGTAAVSLAGWSVQYASSAGSTWQKTDLGGSIQPGGYYLIQQAAGAGGTVALPTPDATGSIAMSATGGKVALTNFQTLLSGGCPDDVVDFVGYGAANCFEGAGPTPAPSNTNAVLRVGNGTVETDNNAADFAAGPPNPRNSGGTGPTPEPTATPEVTPTPSPTLTPTLTPIPLPLTRIREIQGASHVSLLLDATVRTEGVVTLVRNNGFWIQDPAPDADDETSEGIFVFTGSAPGVAVGSALSVSGRVGEFRPGGSSGTTNLSITQLTSPQITTLGSDNPLPAPVVVGPGGRVPPTTVIDDDATGDVETSGSFDATTDGIDFYESLEGMRLQLNDAVATGPTNDFDEIPVLAANGAGAGLRTARGGIVVRPGDFNPERIILDQLNVALPALDTGDQLPGATIGVLDYSFGNFKLLVTQVPAALDNGPAREVTAAAAAGQLAISTFNVENLDPADGPAKFDALAAAIVVNLRSPDIIALEEVQDNNGPTNDATVSADATYTTLIAAIQAAGGPRYSFRQVDPVDDQDGGEPGGNIRVGFLFRTDRGLSFVDRVGGGSTTANAVVAGPNGPQLQFSPGRIEPANPAFNNSRKPLAGEFVYDGNRVFVIANHFNSKGGDQPLFGRFQPPQRVTEAQRQEQAESVRGFVEDILALDARANVVVLGDLNDFEFSDALATLTAGGILNNLIETLPPNERYTYVFEGNSQALDHILVSDELFENAIIGYDIVHINAEFVEQISDHDPQVARITFPAAPRSPVRPVLECVAANEDGSFTARWGYRNDNPFPARVPIGRDNRFSPPPEARGQPSVFQPGRVRFAFETRFDARQTLVWTLLGRTATASRYGSACR